MSDLRYYYADHTGRAVGPLKLDEIRQFVSAGVIPSDVMVCEAGGEHWKSLAIVRAATAKIPIDPPSVKMAERIELIDPSRAADRLTWHFIHALDAAMVANAMITWEMVTLFIETPGKFEEFVPTISLLASLWAIAAFAILIYQSFRLLPSPFRFTTPVKATGFFLIPVFSVYWLFRVLLGLARGVRSWHDSKVPPPQGQFRHLQRLVPLAITAASASAVIEVLGIFLGLYLDMDSPPPDARGYYFMLTMVDAVCYTAIFAVLRAVIRSMRELIDPGREDRIKKEPRPFFRPEYLEVGITGGFIGAAALIWARSLRM